MKFYYENMSKRATRFNFKKKSKAKMKGPMIEDPKKATIKVL